MTFVLEPFEKPIALHRKFGIPRDRLYKAIREKELRTINLGTPQRPSYFIYQSEFQRWLESCAEGGQK